MSTAPHLHNPTSDKPESNQSLKKNKQQQQQQKNAISGRAGEIVDGGDTVLL